MTKQGVKKVLAILLTIVMAPLAINLVSLVIEYSVFQPPPTPTNITPEAATATPEGATPMPSDTPPPTVIFTATPSSTPSPSLVPLRDIPLPLSDLANDTIFTLWPKFPVGEQNLGGIRFLIPAQDNKISTECANGFNWPTEFRVDVTGGIYHPESIHILINAGYTTDFNGLKIGEIQLVFADKSATTFDLILGQNIREWRIQVAGTVPVASDSNLHEVYRGLTAAGDIGVLDMLSLSIPGSHKEGTLTQIILRDVSQKSVSSANPCFSFFGITVKSRS